MSWIFGIIHKKKEILPVPKIITDEALFSYRHENLEIYSGGTLRTIHSDINKEAGINFLVSGLGILKTGSGIRLFGKDEWTKVFAGNGFRNIDGHFIAIDWNSNRLSIQGDVLGLRDIYVKDSPERIIFSTRIDWIAKLEKLKLNFSEFGGKWLMINQISQNSVVKNVERIVCGTKADINLHSFAILYNKFNWLPQAPSKDISKEEFFDSLNEYLTSADGLPFSLSFSGGMESRVLLSMFLGGKDRSWDTHTFGDPHHPDAIMTEKISRELNFPHEHIDLPISSAEEFISGAAKYSCQTLVNNPVSSFPQFNNYKAFIGSERIFVDGGFGEIWRREFFRRLQWYNKKAVYERDSKKILEHLSFIRPEIFNPDVLKLMADGCVAQIDERIEAMPPIEELGIENWLDLLIIKTRLVNVFGIEQSRLDGIIQNFMPLCNLSMFNDLYSVPLSLKRDAKLYKWIVRKEHPALAKYPLVKGSGYSPFYLSSAQTRILSRVKSKLKLGAYRNNRNIEALNMLKEPVMDMVNSQAVKEYPEYNYNVIKNIAEEYYNGNTSYASQLDWLIAFELFRKEIS